jgi:hypothetical protein
MTPGKPAERQRLQRAITEPETKRAAARKVAASTSMALIAAV